MDALNQRVSEAISSRSGALAADAVALEFLRHPHLEKRFGKTVPEKMLQDTGFHFDYLAQAIAAGSVDLYLDYIGWAKVLLANLGVPPMYLATTLESMRDALRAMLAPELSDVACPYLEETLQGFPQMPEEVPSFIAKGNPLPVQYLQALLRGESQAANKLIMDAIEGGMPVQDIYLEVFERTQHEIGRLWQVNEISVAQEHYCTAATQQIMARLYPHIFREEKTRGTLVATCVSGDLHEVGARMVCDFFELDGWDTHYLGANVPAATVVQSLVECRATMLAISATITSHVRAVAVLIALVRSTPQCEGVKILVGGYPFKVEPELWKTIGADGSANGAREAIELANRLTHVVAA